MRFIAIQALTFVIFLLAVSKLAGQASAIATYPTTISSASGFRYDTTFTMKKRPYLAAAEVFALNIGVWVFDRYVLQGDYAYIGTETMKNNLKTGFVWDNDGFSTNLLSHPYHGSLYFNTARNNGMNFWQSTPYVLGGSLMWELFMENEPPSINDLVATTVGGIALGEVTFRLSSLILDDSKHGTERVVREFFAAVASPMRAVNRISTGSMWCRRGSNSFITEQSPFSMRISTGWRYLAQDNYLFKGDNGAFIDLIIKYGDPFENDMYRPFDYFMLRTMFNVGGNQPMIGSVNALGLIWGQTFDPLPEHTMTLGVFQHFDFYQSTAIRNSDVTPFEIAQAAAIGGGLMYKFPRIGNRIDMSYNVYANVVLMGGSVTDHFIVNDRDYNMGSGFSIKFQSLFEINRKVSFFMGFEHYQLFTWKGYPNEPNPIPSDVDIEHLNAQGNAGQTVFKIINPSLSINVSPRITVGLDPYIYWRSSYYKYFDDVKFNTFETRLSVTYLIH